MSFYILYVLHTICNLCFLFGLKSGWKNGPNFPLFQVIIQQTYQLSGEMSRVWVNDLRPDS